MLVTPSRSLRVENPARQRDIHRKVRERAQAERNSHTRFHQSYQSMSGLLAGWLDDWDFGLDNCRGTVFYIYAILATRKGGPMSQKRIQQIEQRIDRIKKALLEIGPMRPGSLSRQYKDPPHQAGAYWQISYTRRMKSRTEYVRREWVKEIRRQTATHKRFKRLVDQWIDLSIEHSRLTMQIAEPRASR